LTERFHDGVLSESSEEVSGDDKEYLHTRNHCHNIVLNLDYDYNMAKENEWMNIRLQATFDNVLKALECGCSFAKNISRDMAPRTNLNGRWVLVGHLQVT